MGIRLIAVDLDGTLLNEENQISPRTIEALTRAEEQGILIVPATGRCKALLPRELLQNLKIRYTILENGAEIWDCEEGRALYKQRLKEETTRWIYQKVRNREGFAEFFRNGEAYAEISSLERLREDQVDRNFINYFRQNHIFVQNLEQLPDVLEQTEKINLYDLPSSLRAELVAALERDESCTVTSSAGNNLEVQGYEIEKGKALRILCEQLNILPEEVLAFGDGQNDLEMLRYAGTGIAMGNADGAIRQEADGVTRSNRADGVAVYLETITF